MEHWDASELSPGGAGYLWCFTELQRSGEKLSRKTEDGQTWASKCGRAPKNGFPDQICVNKLVICSSRTFHMIELTLNQEKPTIALCKIWRNGNSEAASRQTPKPSVFSTGASASLQPPLSTVPSYGIPRMDNKVSAAYNVLEHMLLDESAEPVNLPLSLLEAITNDFSHEQEIGRGGFAVVYKGMVGDGMVAVKKLFEVLDVDEEKFNQEVQCQMKVQHTNIVRFLGYCGDTQRQFTEYEGKFFMADLRNRLLCFEFVPNGSLHDYITDASHGLEWRVRYKMIEGICEGLNYLHEKRIVHLDLKPTNILLDNNMVPKIADFGISRCFDEMQSQVITTKLIGSLGYLAPEYFFSGQITYKSDIYSLGVLITEIVTGKKVLESWRKRLETSQEQIPVQLDQVRTCAEMGIKCRDTNPENRPMIHSIIKTFHDLRK